VSWFRSPVWLDLSLYASRGPMTNQDYRFPLPTKSGSELSQQLRFNVKVGAVIARADRGGDVPRAEESATANWPTWTVLFVSILLLLLAGLFHGP
jgi:hypothetical protein